MSTANSGSAEGYCHDDFAAVREAFEVNLASRGEVGAGYCVTVDGERVVDLWGGVADAQSEAPWTADTMTTVYSCTKGMTALCAHVLAARGQLDLDAAVADYWPEFAQTGKEAATVRMMLNHTVGVPALRERLPQDAVYDWDFMVRALENEEPFWEPGTRQGYHMITFGWTVGELVRRVSGQSLGTFLREQIAEPLGADIWLGLPEEHEPRTARVLAHVIDKDLTPSLFTQSVISNRSGIPSLALLNQGRWNPNSREAHMAELGGAGGIASARGLAAMYAPLGQGGGDLVDADGLANMTEVAAATERDATLVTGMRFSLGFMKSMDNRGRHGVDPDSVILGPRAFGHVGAGGSLGMADPDHGMSIGYVMNQMGPGLLLNERGQSLVDATYASHGIRPTISS